MRPSRRKDAGVEQQHPSRDVRGTIEPAVHEKVGRGLAQFDILEPAEVGNCRFVDVKATPASDVQGRVGDILAKVSGVDGYDVPAGNEHQYARRLQRIVEPDPTIDAVARVGIHDKLHLLDSRLLLPGHAVQPRALRQDRKIEQRNAACNVGCRHDGDN